MKNFIKISLGAFAAALMFAACSQSNSDKLELSADPLTILSNGTDQVTFTVKFNDTDVTAEAQIKNVTTGEFLPEGTTTFSSTTHGEVEFMAVYDGKNSNTVKITVELAEILALKASQTTVLDNGTDEAVFTVLYEGEDVTTSAKVKNVTLDQYVEGVSGGVKKITFNSLEKYEFVAEYNDEISEPIIVSAKPSRDFYRKVGAFKFTGTKCVYCPGYAEVLDQVVAAYPDRAEIIAVHVNIPTTDEMVSAQASLFSKAFGINSAPSGVVDLRKTVATTHASTLSAIKLSVRDYPAESGFRVTSTLTSEDKVNVKIQMWTNDAQEYGLGVLLMEDGLVFPQSGLEGVVDDYVHNHVFRHLATGNRIYGEELGMTEANGLIEREYTFDLFSTSYLLSTANKTPFVAENCYLLIYSTVPIGATSYTINNLVKCPLNGTIDYAFEEE